MNVDLGIWDRLTRFILALLVFAVLAGAAVCYWPLLQQNERMRKVVLQLDADIAREQAVERQLRAQNDALRSDPKAVERLARERLGYAKPGETVMRFEEPESGSYRGSR
jgi:cell division protein FtsB